jgi:hypothetical protein
MWIDGFREIGWDCDGIDESAIDLKLPRRCCDLERSVFFVDPELKLD